MSAGDFWTRVDVREPHECWNWTGRMSSKGYGLTPGRPSKRAHRVAYEIKNGPIAADLVIDHLCRNRGCVNPDHLEPVTNVTNVMRGVGITAINARKTHCVNGHQFTEENTLRRNDGTRECRACKTDRARVRRRGERSAS